MLTMSILDKRTLLTMPIETIEMIIKELKQEDFASVFMTCKFLNSLCEHPKFWKTLEVNIKNVISDTIKCEEIVKKYSSKGVTKFRLFCPRNDPEYERIGDYEIVDECAVRVMKHLPKGIEKLDIPIFMFQRAMNLLPILKQFTDLRHFEMGNNIQFFGKFPVWQKKNNSIKEMLTILFAELKKLKIVKIHDCHGFLEEPLEMLISNNENIEILDASYCWSIDRPGLESLSKLKFLKKLKIVCVGAYDEDISALIRCCQELEKLDISWTNVTGNTFDEIYKYNQNVKFLNVVGCHGINYDDLKQFCTNASFLKELFIR